MRTRILPVLGDHCPQCWVQCELRSKVKSKQKLMFMFMVEADNMLLNLLRTLTTLTSNLSGLIVDNSGQILSRTFHNINRQQHF